LYFEEEISRFVFGKPEALISCFFFLIFSPQRFLHIHRSHEVVNPNFRLTFSWLCKYSWREGK